MKEYRHASWLQFRRNIIKLHNGRCARCARSPTDGIVLQVHHKQYVSGRLPWEYDPVDCEALCKGCHAAEHGIIMPRDGWICVGVDDLGDLNGSCELCGTNIRYVYAIEHAAWGSMAVGTVCCDKLTGTLDASAHHANHIKATDTLKRFVSSKRWKERPAGGESIKQKGINVSVFEANGVFRISMNGIVGKGQFESAMDAKIKVFTIINSGEAHEFLQRRRQREREAMMDALSKGY